MDQENKILNKPCYLEFWLIVITGTLHVAVELLWSGIKRGISVVGLPECIYNLAAILVWASYVIWRIIVTRGIARAWGFRRDNFLAALRPSVYFLILGTIALSVYGGVMGQWRLPATFWIVLLLYPLYGIVQQFALQILITKNLRGVVKTLLIRVLLAASLFSAVHFPNYRLMLLTFLAGLMFTWIYNRHPNIWAVGISHGLLGAFAYYWVLGLDPGAKIVEGIRRFLF